MVIVNTVVIVRGMLGGSEADVAIVLAAYGAGSMAVAFVLPRLLERASDGRSCSQDPGCLPPGRS